MLKINAVIEIDEQKLKSVNDDYAIEDAINRELDWLEGYGMTVESWKFEDEKIKAFEKEFFDTTFHRKVVLVEVEKIDGHNVAYYTCDNELFYALRDNGNVTNFRLSLDEVKELVQEVWGKDDSSKVQATEEKTVDDIYDVIENRIFNELNQYKGKDGDFHIPLNIPINITDVPEKDISYIRNANNPENAAKHIKEGYLEEFYLSDDFDFALQEKIVSQHLSQETLFLIHKHKFDMTDFISNYINYDYDINNLTLELPEELTNIAKITNSEKPSKVISSAEEFASKLFGYFVSKGELEASDTDMYQDIRSDAYNLRAKEWLEGMKLTEETKPFFKYLYESNPSFKDENIWIVVYKDTLNYQDDKDNLTQISVPTKWLLDYFWNKNILPDEWIDEYTADDTEAIVDKAIEDGVILECSDMNINISKFWKTNTSLDNKIQNAEYEKSKQPQKENADKSEDLIH